MTDMATVAASNNTGIVTNAILLCFLLRFRYTLYCSESHLTLSRIGGIGISVKSYLSSLKDIYCQNIIDIPPPHRLLSLSSDSYIDNQ